MKFNFRKITSVLASAVMLGSTMGIAAAANYPAPFVTSSGADVAVVIGANAPLDYAAALNLGTNLQYELSVKTMTPSSSSGPSTSGEGDKVKVETTSQKLNIGTNLTTARATKLTYNDMPTLLAKKTYRSYDSQTYDYEQEVTIGPNIPFAHFSDNDYLSAEPTLGVHLSTIGTPILNYTITFITPAESDVNTAGRLEDLQNTKLWILGKEYTLLNAFNSTKKLELMAGSTVATITLNEEKPIPVKLASGETKDYVVKLTFVDADSAKLEVNGEATGDLSIGGTFKLSDGTQVGVRDVSYQAFQGGVMSAEISLGAEKLTLENGATVKLNDKTTGMNGVTAYVTSSTSGTRQTINSITIAWTSDDEVFITPTKELVMPGFGSLKFVMGNLTMPTQEITKITNDGNYGIKIVAPLAEGTSSFVVLSGNGTAFDRVGQYGSGATKLVTTNTQELIWDSDTDKYFVASWNSSTAAKSYLVDLKTELGENSVNQTKVRVLVDGANVEKGSFRAGQTVSLGSELVLTINTIDRAANRVNITGSGGVSFNKMFTKDGLLMYLPVETTAAGDNNVNFTSASIATWPLKFHEEDKFGTLDNGALFNITVGAWTTDSKVQVSSLTGPFVSDTGSIGSANTYETSSGSQKRVGYIKSALGTKVTHDQSPTQDTAEIEYHGGETYGNLWIASPSITVSGDSGGSSGGSAVELGNPVVYDNEVTQGYTKNLIILGGSCVNTIAAKMLGSSTPLCGAQFTEKTTVGADQFIVKVGESPVNAAKIAMLVAGYEAQDTVKAATYVRTSKPATDKGTEIVKKTVEVASSV